MVVLEVALFFPFLCSDKSADNTPLPSHSVSHISIFPVFFGVRGVIEDQCFRWALVLFLEFFP